MASPFALTTNEIRLLHNQCDANKSSDGQPSTIAAEVPSFDSENDPPHLSSIRSTATMRTSNTTKRRSEKKLEKQAFLYFLEILMSLVKEKDEKVFRHAKLVICRCEQQKRRGEIESFVESLRYPLKLAVGPRFWAEARERLRRALLRSCPGRPSLISAVEQLVEPSNHVFRRLGLFGTLGNAQIQNTVEKYYRDKNGKEQGIDETKNETVAGHQCLYGRPSKERFSALPQSSRIGQRVHEALQTRSASRTKTIQ